MVGSISCIYQIFYTIPDHVAQYRVIPVKERSYLLRVLEKLKSRNGFKFTENMKKSAEYKCIYNHHDHMFHIHIIHIATFCSVCLVISYSGLVLCSTWVIVFIARVLWKKQDRQ